MVKGIDVSRHNGAIDWTRVKDAGYGFAMLRACYGWDNDKQIDPRLRGNVEGCEAAGLPYGLYHYSYALNAGDARKEAAFFLRVIAGMKPLYPVAFDFEEKAQLALPLERQLEIIGAFLGELEAAGYYGVLYMSASPYKALLEHDRDRLCKYDAWIAQWSGKQCAVPCGMWQYAVVGMQGLKGRNYTAYGSVPGVDTNCDVNYAYKDYPAIIRSGGLNGWGAEAPQPPGGETVPRVQYDELARRYEELWQRYEDVAEGVKALAAKV